MALRDIESQRRQMSGNGTPAPSRGVGEAPEGVAVLLQKPDGILCTVNCPVPDIENSVKVDQESPYIVQAISWHIRSGFSVSGTTGADHPYIQSIVTENVLLPMA